MEILTVYRVLEWVYFAQVVITAASLFAYVRERALHRQTKLGFRFWHNKAITQEQTIMRALDQSATENDTLKDFNCN